MSRPNERGRLRPGAVPVRPGEPWITGRVYQWNGVQWFMIPPPTETNRQNADLYLTATSDATEGAPEAIFSFAQIRSLVASSIFANLVGAKNIIVNANGSIQSEDWIPGERGFIIRANGSAEFNDIRLRGHVDADTGFLQHIHIGSLATFEGSIHSGPLIASNEISTPTGRTWSAQTTIGAIKADLGIGVAEARTLSVSGGSFGTTTGLLRLEFSRIHFRTVNTAQGIPMPVTGDRLRIVFPNDTFTVDDTSPSGLTVNPGRINQALTIGGTSSGKTLRLIDLPTGGGGLPAGTVYRDSGGFLRVV